MRTDDPMSPNYGRVRPDEELIRSERERTDDPMSPNYGRVQLDEERIRQRAWEISQSEEAGTPEENWQRAEHELWQAERQS